MIQNAMTKSLVLQVPIVTDPRAKLDCMANPLELLEFSRRMNEICDDMGIPPKGMGRQTGLAARFKVSQRAALKWLEGETYPSVDHAKALCAWSGVSFEWLMTGHGQKKPAGTYADPVIERVVTVLQAMEPDKRYLAARLVDTLAKPDLKNGTQ